jgi:hypothetical protein
VHVRFHARHRGYEVWCQNRPLITLRDGVKLKRHEAYALVREMNR